MPFGDIVIEFHKGFVKNFSRKLDLSTAVHTVEYIKSDVRYKRTSFVSFPDKAFVMKIEADKKGVVEFTLKMNSPLRNVVSVENDSLILDGICPSLSPSNIDVIPKEEFIEYSDDEDKKGMSFRGAVKVKADGNVTYNNTSVTVSGASTAYVYFTCESSFNGFDKHPNLEGKEYKNACLSMLAAVYNKDMMMFSQLMSMIIKHIMTEFHLISEQIIKKVFQLTKDWHSSQMTKMISVFMLFFLISADILQLPAQEKVLRL